ncbi:MAG: HD domain-containing protein [Oscillospiraceae bacterium]|nr:HD domain-containing protein [Oscillospiraceae bacterium]
MTFFTCVFLLTELLMLAMILHVVGYSGFSRGQKTWYLATFLSVAFCAAAEYIALETPYQPSRALPLTVLTVLQFSVVPLLGVLFSGALGIHHRGRFVAAFFAVSLLTETVAAIFGWAFRFDDAGYSRGPLFFLVYGSFNVASMLYLIRNMFLVGRRFRRKDTRTIAMVLVILIAGIVPMAAFRVNIAYLAVAISASLCYIYYNDLVQQDSQEDLLLKQRRITDMQTQMVSGMANLIESRDLETGQHIARTGRYVRLLAERAREDGVYTDQLTDRFISLLTMLAPLHDIGKILVPDRILQKPGKLTPEEYEAMKRHAADGGKVVRKVMFGLTDEDSVCFAEDIAKFHHERWDGSGYPEGRKGEKIPLCARIMAIADVFDALMSERCYKEPYPGAKAVEIIRAEAGRHFDPELVRVFLNHKEEFLS